MKQLTTNLGLLALLMTSLTLAGCNDSSNSDNTDSGSGNGSGSHESGDNGADGNGTGHSSTGLSVIETNPDDGAVGIDLQPTITAIFNADVGSSDQDNKIDLYLHSSRIDTTKSTLGAPADRVTLTPVDSLSRGTTYTVRISGDFEDDDFRTLGTAYEWTFSTVDKTFGSAFIVNDEEGVPGHTSESMFQLVDDEGGRSPVVAVDSQGNMIVVWLDRKSDTTFDLWTRYFDADNDLWLAAERLLTDGNFSDVSNEGPYTPALAMDGSGNAIVATHDRVGDKHQVLAYHFDSTTQTWSTPETVLELTDVTETGFNDADFRSPSLAINQGGKAILAWTQYRSTDSLTDKDTIWSALYESGVGWTVPKAIGQTGRLATLPSVAMSETGEGMVVWAQGTGVFDEYPTYAVGVDSEGNWDDTAVQLEDVEKTGRRNQTRLIELGNGEFLALWRPRAIGEVRASHFDGVSWTAPETIGDAYMDTGFGPVFDAVKTSEDEVLVVWQRHRFGQITTESETIPRPTHEYALWSAGSWSEATPLPYTDNVIRDVDQDVTLSALDNGTVLMARFGQLQGSGSIDRVFVQSYLDGTWSQFATVPGCFGDQAKKPMLATAGNEAVLISTHGDVCAYFYE